MSKSPSITQSAAERRAAVAELRKLISRFASGRERLVSSLRRWLQQRLPTAHEIVYEYNDCFVISYSPSAHGYEGVLAIRGSADSVQLYFQKGKDLPDPEKLLQGKAGARWIVVEKVAALARPEFASLIGEALARNPVPFALSGRGSVIVSPSTAKKRSTKKHVRRKP